MWGHTKRQSHSHHWAMRHLAVPLLFERSGQIGVGSFGCSQAGAGVFTPGSTALQVSQSKCAVYIAVPRLHVASGASAAVPSPKTEQPLAKQANTERLREKGTSYRTRRNFTSLMASTTCRLTYYQVIHGLMERQLPLYCPATWKRERESSLFLSLQRHRFDHLLPPLCSSPFLTSSCPSIKQARRLSCGDREILLPYFSHFPLVPITNLLT